MPQRTGRERHRLYDDLAWTWPIVSPPDDYVEEAEATWGLLARHARGPIRTLLHLGCGGGHIDRTVKGHARITGVDVSGRMLDLARALNPDVEYVRGDMRTTRLRRTFDAVLIADSIAYMRTEADLLAAFRTAFLHLRPGGIFLTEVEQTPDTFQEGRTTSTTHARGGVEITFIENLHDPDPRDTTYEARFLYLIREGGRVRLEKDRHTCGIFRLATWERLLGKAGFQSVRLGASEDRRDDEAVATFVGLKPARRSSRTPKRPRSAGRSRAGRRPRARTRGRRG